MTIYKLHITYQLDTTDDQDKAIAEAIQVLKAHKLASSAMVTLNRDGDKSSANLLMPINEKHFKHAKVPVNDILDLVYKSHMAITDATPDSKKDVHTEHCCTICGCKYSNKAEDCSVNDGSKRQSFPHSDYI